MQQDLQRAQRAQRTHHDFTAGYENPFDALHEERSAAARSNKAVLYLRESDQASLGSRRHGIARGTVPQQRDDAQDFADYLGLEVIGEYLDLDQGDRWGRNVLQQMLRDLEAGTFHHIIIQHPDRLSRGTEVKQRFKDRVAAANGKYYYATLPIAHEDSLSGEMTETMANVASGMEKQRIRERTQSMRLRRAKSGKLIVGAFPKYGYNWVRDARMRVVDYAIDPETAPVAREILTRIAQGDAIRQLIHDLNQRGIPTRGQVLKARGLLSPNQAAKVKNHWVRNHLAAIVYSPDYSGWHLNYHSVSTYEDRPHPLTGLPRTRPQRKQMLRRDGMSYLPLAELREQFGEFFMRVPAIVDEATQEAAIARFQKQSRERQPGREDALLAGGYVRCAYCKHPMAVQRVKAPTRNGQNDYFCTHVPSRTWQSNGGCSVVSNHVAVSKLDTLVWNQLVAGLKSPDVLVALLTRASLHLVAVEENTGRVAQTTSARLAKLEQDFTALVQQTLDPHLNATARAILTEHMNQLGEQIDEAKAHLAEERKALANQRQVQKRIAQVKDWATQLSDSLDHLDFAEKRRVLFLLGVQVFVWRGRDPENATDPQRAGQRYTLHTDFTGMNLGARLGTDWEVAQRDMRYKKVITNNNASNYSIANAFDMQELLGLTVAGGEVIPDPVAQTLAERAATDHDADGTDAASENGKNGE